MEYVFWATASKPDFSGDNKILSYRSYVQLNNINLEY